MPQAIDKKQPAQVPGDAESPPSSEADPNAARAVTRTDRTEPTQSERKDQKPA